MKNIRRMIYSVALAFFAMHADVANAQVSDSLIEGAKLCTRNLQRYETEYGIPSHLLSAIASTESGRFHERLKIRLPWPWTINAEGKGYFFDTKEEAVEAAKKMMARGVQSMDIGCMQVNIYHHPNAFSSLSQGFEPEYNVAYAANFLRSLYQEEGSWRKAASNYHSKTPNLGSKYVGLVYNSWFQILSKLRSARLNVPSSSVKALNDMRLAQMESTATAPKYIKVDAAKSNGEIQYKNYGMKTIKISEQGVITQSNAGRRKENGVIVVRPEIKVVTNTTQVSANKISPPEPMVIADAGAIGNNKQSVADLVPSAGVQRASVNDSGGESEAKIIRLDNKLVSARHPVNTMTNKKSGPNFIFSD